MNRKENHKRSVISKVWNVLFFALLILFIFSTDAKSWVLRQLVSVGLFKAEIKKDAALQSVPAEATSFVFNDAEGKQVSTEALRGKVVFINFWATWCPPCRAEMPSLNALYNKLKGDERIVFLFINEDEDLSKAKSFLQQNGYDLPLITRSGTIPAALYNGTLPTTVVLDKEGRVVLKHEGVANYNTSDFIQQLKDLL